MTRRIKYQTMLVCINAAGETLCSLIVTTDRSTLGVFRDGIEENVDLKVHVGQSAHVDATLFHDYLRGVLIAEIGNFPEANETPDSPAILVMDNCFSHLTEHILGLLSPHKIKILTFPPHSSGTFQMLDLVFFGVFKKCLAKDGSIPVMADHAMRMFKACEAARASSAVRACFARAGFVYHKVPDGGYILGFDEGMMRDSAEFREVWKINFPLESLTARRRATQRGFLNAESFNS
jgi:hypothetical protein